MEIQIKAVGKVQVIEIVGDIDASTAPKLTETLLPLVGPDSRLLLDMTQVPYMSSAGLRTLLSFARQTKVKNGQAVLVGLSEDLTDTMSVTGFLSLFVTKATQAEGLTALGGS